MRTIPTLLLSLTVAVGAAVACDRPPVLATSPGVDSPQPPCFGKTTHATPTDDGWGVSVFVVSGPHCNVYHCTVRDAGHTLTPNGAIIECRRLNGVTGPHV